MSKKELLKKIAKEARKKKQWKSFRTKRYSGR